MQFNAVVDRIEEGKAVLLVGPDENTEILWPLQKLPENVSEGIVLNIEVEIDYRRTKAAEKRVKNLLDKLKDKTDKMMED